MSPFLELLQICRPGNGMETVLAAWTDGLLEMAEDQVSLLILTDLPAATDAVDHDLGAVSPVDTSRRT